MIALVISTFAFNCVADDTDDSSKLKQVGMDNGFGKEILDNTQQIKTRVGTFNSTLKKNGQKVLFVSLLLIGIGAILIYLVYSTRKFQDRVLHSYHLLDRKIDKISSNIVTVNILENKLLQLMKNLKVAGNPKSSQGANLEPTPNPTNPNPAFYNAPSGPKVKKVDSDTNPTRIAVAYDPEKNVFIKSTTSKLYYLLAKSRLVELWLEERMCEINDISFQNEFSQFFEISQTSDKSRSSGYYVVKPASVVWDGEKNTGSLKYLGQINRNSN